MQVGHEVRKMGSLKSMLITALIGLTMLMGSAALGQQTNVVLDGTSKGRVFDGLGAASAGASSRLLIDYPEPQPGVFELRDVVSRKKQLLPYLTHCLQRMKLRN